MIFLLLLLSQKVVATNLNLCIIPPLPIRSSSPLRSHVTAQNTLKTEALACILLLHYLQVQEMSNFIDTHSKLGVVCRPPEISFIGLRGGFFGTSRVITICRTSRPPMDF